MPWKNGEMSAVYYIFIRIPPAQNNLIYIYSIILLRDSLMQV